MLQIDLRGPSCGDGSVETGEQCDDGNNVPGDGCDAVCQFEITLPIATLPGRVVPVNIVGPTAIAVVAVELDRPGQSIAARATEQPGDACDVIDTAIELYDANINLPRCEVGRGPVRYGRRLRERPVPERRVRDEASPRDGTGSLFAPRTAPRA